MQAKLLEFEKELKKLNEKKKELESSLEVTKKVIQESQDSASKIRDEISVVENTHVHGVAEENKLQRLRDLLEIDLDELKNLK